MEWDVKIGDPIEYFDPNLSYEITGYRPINKTQGLDFNPDWFREDAINKMNTGSYSRTIYGSRAYKEFWDERFKRSTEGYTVNGYRITGDNYFWLNFYRLKQSLETDKASAGRKVSFPMFLVFQYVWFHYIEMCEILKKDAWLLKARALGISEVGASLSIRPFVTTPNFRTIVSAYSDRQLKPTLAKIWPQLDWLNEETEGAFKRVRMVINTNTHKRASKKKKDGGEEGHMAEIEGIIADSPEKLRGDRVERLIFEEAGSDKVLITKYLQAEALITVLGGVRVGTRIGWGTGGDSGSSVEGIRRIITEPDVYNILKYRHNHTPDRSYTLSGMFLPAYEMVASLLDKRGWCDPEEARAWYEKERLLKASDPKALLTYKAEFCFTIEEALLQQGDNIFPKEELAEQLAAIQVYKRVEKPDVGSLVWEVDKHTEEYTGRVLWRKNSVGDNYGKIQIAEHPLTADDGQLYSNLYVGGIDGIDIGTGDSTGTDSNPSEFCIVIKKRAFGLDTPRYVAIYKDRPRDVREAYENAAKLLTYYGCQGVLESTRTAIITHFRNTKRINLLMKRPRATMSDTVKGNSNMIGAPATVKTITHYRELIYDFCLDYSPTIQFEEMVEQLLNYSDLKKKDFDIVASMGMAELGDEELANKAPRTKTPVTKEFRDMGWWTDSRGYKHYGIIPKTEEEQYEKRRSRTEDSWLFS